MSLYDSDFHQYTRIIAKFNKESAWPRSVLVKLGSPRIQYYFLLLLRKNVYAMNISGKEYRIQDSISDDIHKQVH